MLTAEQQLRKLPEYLRGIAGRTFAESPQAVADSLRTIADRVQDWVALALPAEESGQGS